MYLGTKDLRNFQALSLKLGKVGASGGKCPHFPEKFWIRNENRKFYRNEALQNWIMLQLEILNSAEKASKGESKDWYISILISYVSKNSHM